MLKKLRQNTSIFGITKIRNESEIIKDTLDYYSDFCDKIFIYDDASTDNTLDIVKKHPKVAGIIEAKVWDNDRYRAEWQSRQAVLELAKKGKPEWFLYFDADERVIIDENIDITGVDGVVMKLFDYYITEEDKEGNYLTRKWLGPEYREILMLFRNMDGIRYETPDQREVTMPLNAKIAKSGFVKHYGKAISVEEWEKTCDYYSTYWDEPYKSKWKKRKGCAVHDKSDFSAKLITWDQIDTHGYPL